jgi:hypothetical protein
MPLFGHAGRRLPFPVVEPANDLILELVPGDEAKGCIRGDVWLGFPKQIFPKPFAGPSVSLLGVCQRPTTDQSPFILGHFILKAS